MNMNMKQAAWVTALGVSLFAALMNLSDVLAFARECIGLILPVIVGGILALFIHVPMNGIKKHLFRAFAKSAKRPSDKAIHISSFVLTLVCILLVLTLVLTLLIPEIARSVQSLYAQVEERLADIRAREFDVQWIEEMISNINLEEGELSAGVNALFTNAVGVVSSTVSIVVTAAFALIISIYISLGKEDLAQQARRVICACLKPKWSERILRVCRMFLQSFTKFLSGQCTEAIILGTLMFAAFSLFRLPYGSLVGVLTAVCALIPYVGAFLSCAVSVFLTLIIEPTLALRCLAVYLAIQFIENQLIYPRVVGGSVGLPPLYTLVAAMIGGKLFGIIGIVFFIPLVAVAHELITTYTNKRLGIE